MLNQIVIVGRIVNNAKIKEDKAKVVVAVPRNYKNDEGVYETDFIPCQLYGDVAKNTLEYCTKGDLIGVKGRIETENNKTVIKAERITFLSSKPRE